MTLAWKLAARFAVLAVACFVAGLLRDPMRGHLIPRETFVNVFQAAVALAAAAALAAGILDLRSPRADRWGTLLPAAIGVAYVDVIHAWAWFYNIAAFGCGTAAVRSFSHARGNARFDLALMLVLALVAVKRDGDRRRAARCVALVLALWASQLAFPFVLDRDRTKPAAHQLCFRVQRHIADAVEMYNLDRNTKADRLTPELWRSLQSGGYLQTSPVDPDVKPPTSATYSLSSTAPLGITCSRHGPATSRSR